jgi:hypothetical protein
MGLCSVAREPVTPSGQKYEEEGHKELQVKPHFDYSHMDKAWRFRKIKVLTN